MACRDKCEGKVRTVNAYVEQNMRNTPTVLKAARRTSYYSALILGGIGTVLFSLGFIDDDHYQKLMGVCFALYGGVMGLRIYKSSVPYRYPLGHCQNCGNDLKGITSGLCPECGRKL